MYELSGVFRFAMSSDALALIKIAFFLKSRSMDGSRFPKDGQSNGEPSGLISASIKVSRGVQRTRRFHS